MADPDRRVDLGSFASPGEAEAIAALLSAEGIPSRILDLDGLGFGHHVGMGRLLTVRVHERDRARAGEVLGSATDADVEAEALAASPGPGDAAEGPSRAPRHPAATSTLRGRGRFPLLAVVVALATALLVARSCSG